MSMSPKDLDFIEAKHGAAREIALALGVPPMLLAIPGDNTFSNYQEANRTFWRQTVLPLVQRIISACDEWLTPGYSGTLSLKPNIDDIPALSIEQDTLWARLEKTSFLTDDEKRAVIGYGPLPPQQKFNPGQIRKPSGKPGGGQWTKPGGDSGGGGNPSNGDGTDGIGDGNGDNGDTGEGAPTDPFGDGLGNIDPEAIQIPEEPTGGTDEIVDPPTSSAGPGEKPQPIAGRPGYGVDILEEDANGGHTYERHVGKSERYLIDRVNSDAKDIVDRGDNFRGLSRSSFTSVDSAQKLVNAALASDPAEVSDVVAGRRPYGVINYEAGSYTGYEAYLERYNSQAYIRGTYGVRVVIRSDPGSERGYRVISAFPTR